MFITTINGDITTKWELQSGVGHLSYTPENKNSAEMKTSNRFLMMLFLILIYFYRGN